MLNFKCVPDYSALSLSPTDCSQQTVFLHPVGSTTNLSTHNISCDGSEVDWSPNSIQRGISEDLNHNHPQWLQIDLGEKRRITGNTCSLHNLISFTYFITYEIVHLWVTPYLWHLLNVQVWFSCMMGIQIQCT